ncbi:MAG: signal peptidase I [Candidatus Sumerlaeota bacterium]
MTDPAIPTPEKKPFKVSRLRMFFGAILLFVTLGCWWAFIIGELGAYQVESGSMEPTMVVNDRVLAKPVSPGSVHAGDIVVVKSPDDEGPDLVKRVVATEGDTVEFRNKHFYLNGMEDPPPGQSESIHPYSSNRSITLTKDQFYVLGDNRPKSHDSEEFGPVDGASIKKIVFWRYWPLSRWGRVIP